MPGYGLSPQVIHPDVRQLARNIFPVAFDMLAVDLIPVVRVELDDVASHQAAPPLARRWGGSPAGCSCISDPVSVAYVTIHV